ncbi:hypothetical protein Tco_1474788 [Tanacetum coccineum]
MHNNIMAAGSRDRPPMLATGRYAQWRSRFLRYIDTRPNGDALRKCILEGPYTPTTVLFTPSPLSLTFLSLSLLSLLLTLSLSSFLSVLSIFFPFLLFSLFILYCNCHNRQSNWHNKRNGRRFTGIVHNACNRRYAQLAITVLTNNIVTRPNDVALRSAFARLDSLGIEGVNVAGDSENCRKPKRVKDSTYHKEKMLLCKQAEKGVQLQAEQSD